MLNPLKALNQASMIRPWSIDHTEVRALADLGGRAPTDPDSFVLTCKISKRSRLGGPRPPPTRSTPPLREILDPPLKSTHLAQNLAT